MDSPAVAEQTERPYISTGHLPEDETVQKLVSEAHRRFRWNTDGQNSQVYPALASVPSDDWIAAHGRLALLAVISAGATPEIPSRRDSK